MRLIYIVCFVTFTEAIDKKWIDPHDMNTNAKEKLRRSLSENSKDFIVEQKESVPVSADENMSLIYLKRIVNLILNSASAEQDNPNVFTGLFRYSLDSEEYQFLNDFTSNKIASSEDIRKLDTVLSTLFSKSYQDSIFNFRIGITKNDFVNTIFHKNFLMMFGITLCLYIMYVLLKNNSGFLYIISYFAVIILIVDFGFRYIHLLEEAEEHNLKVSYSAGCDTDKMNWAEYFQFILKRRDCEKKFVTPLEVGLHQLKYIIIIPLESVGTGMGKFSSELWNNLPFPWNIIIFPIMLVFIIVIIFPFVLAMKYTTFKLKLFHLFHLEFGNPNTDENRVSGPTLDKLLDATQHRKMLEDTRSSPQRTERKKIKSNSSSPKKHEANKKNPKNDSSSSSPKVEKKLAIEDNKNTKENKSSSNIPSTVKIETKNDDTTTHSKAGENSTKKED